MKTYLVHGIAHPIQGSDGEPADNGPGFTSTGTPKVKPGKSSELAVPGADKAKLVSDRPQDEYSNDEAEARFAQQRALIKKWKSENPQGSTNAMFNELSQMHPDVFSDPGSDESDPSDPYGTKQLISGDPAGLNPKAAQAHLQARQAVGVVIGQLKEQYPDWSTDEIYAFASRNRLITD